MRIPRDFFCRDTLTVARELLGQVLVHRSERGIASGVIVETEAYLGRRDPAAHSYKGASERVRAMFGEKGCAYIYLIYGMYHCMNVTSGPKDEPEAVLIRALEPLEGISLMEDRRKTDRLKNLCSGPGKLCIAMDIDKGLYGKDLAADPDFFLMYGDKPVQRGRSKRINIDYAGEAKDCLWRFFVQDSPFVSR